MSSQYPEIDKLISQVVALTWNDLKLKLEPKAARNFSNLALVGKIVSSKPLNR